MSYLSDHWFLACAIGISLSLTWPGVHLWVHRWYLWKRSTSLKCLWSEICFCLVLKFTLSNTRFQSLRRLALKVTILQAFKVEPFFPQKWSLNRAVKIPCDTILWHHFGAKIVLTMADRKERGNREGDIVQPVPQTSFAIFGTFWRVVLHILKSCPTSDGPGAGDKNEIMLKKGCDTNEGHCSIEPLNAIFADALVTSLQQRNSHKRTKFSSEHCSHWYLTVQWHQKMKNWVYN